MLLDIQDMLGKVSLFCDILRSSNMIVYTLESISTHLSTPVHEPPIPDNFSDRSPGSFRGELR